MGFRERALHRLLIPLAFGILVLNLPLVFFAFRRLNTPLGDIASFGWDYWVGLDWLGSIWIEGSHHLWFLRNLFVYSLVLAPVFVFLRNHPHGLLLRTARGVVGLGNGFGLLVLVPLPLIAVELLIKPWASGEVGRGYEFWWYLGLFVIGYVLIQVDDPFWAALDRLRFVALGVGVVTWLLLSDLVADAEAVATLYGRAVVNGGWTEFGFPFWGSTTFPAAVLHSLNTWAWSLAVFAWAARYLNKPSKPLAYFNQSVYPFYIVHMTILLVTLWYVRLWDVWWPVTFLSLTFITFAGCWATFELVKRTKVTGFYSASNPSGTPFTLIQDGELQPTAGRRPSPNRPPTRRSPSSGPEGLWWSGVLRHRLSGERPGVAVWPSSLIGSTSITAQNTRRGRRGSRGCVTPSSLRSSGRFSACSSDCEWRLATGPWPTSTLCLPS